MLSRSSEIIVGGKETLTFLLRQGWVAYNRAHFTWNDDDEINETEAREFRLGVNVTSYMPSLLRLKGLPSKISHGFGRKDF